MLKNLKIGTRLFSLVGFLTVLLIGIGALGFGSARSTNDSLKTVYEDRTVCMGQIARMMSSNLNIVGELRLMLLLPTTEHIAKSQKEVKDDIENIAKTWKEYTSTVLTDEEKKIVEKLEKDRAAYRELALFPILDAIKKGNIAEAKRLNEKVLDAVYDPVEKGWGDLMALQISVAKEEYERSQKNYARVRDISLVALLTGSSLRMRPPGGSSDRSLPR